jgi:PhnB protein
MATNVDGGDPFSGERQGPGRQWTMTPGPHDPVICVMLAASDASEAARLYATAIGATELWNLGGVVPMRVVGAPLFLGEPENNG